VGSNSEIQEYKSVFHATFLQKILWWYNNGTSPNHLATTPHSSNPTPGVLL